MEMTYILLPLALVLSGFGLGCFVWALRNGQFEDLEGPRWRVVFEDEKDT
ncbi:MAG: cbb3-type cytochrome oxidase assembly protein CcoS [Armatimonadetes bacterium]|nr:cbb3-type cytochrome oxidase assembly protein CcoS [Armatimonadota bacterium]